MQQSAVTKTTEVNDIKHGYSTLFLENIMVSGLCVDVLGP